MATSFFRRAVAALVRRAEKRLPSLTRLRAPEKLPIRLDRRRIYILPTGFGFIFALILLVMLLGALNYNNNSALLLTCILAATCVTSMLQTFRSLDQLELHSIQAADAVAGKDMQLSLSWRSGGHQHNAVRVRIGEQEVDFSAASGAAADVQVLVPTQRRGWMTLPRIHVSSRWPFGWFRAWSWLAPGQRVLVYPRCETEGPAPDPAPGDANHRRQTRGDEWSGLRAYRTGDPLRHVAWKASARGDDLRVKTFDRPRADHARHLDWNAIRLTNREARIARLARWVSEAHQGGGSWSLSLPDNSLATGQGVAHYHRSMRALAELP